MQYTFLQNNIQLSRRIIFLLLFFCSFSFASYKSIYNIENPEFKYSIEGNNYKVYMSEEGIIDYKKRTGFKLFLPNFVKEYNLGVLRFNSIGRIDGYLSMSKNINPYQIIDVQGFDIKYYFTDYSKKSQRQLDFLLQGKIIPYIDQTSLAFQGYNISSKISTKLNKWVYFTFDKHYNKNNKLQYLVYSYSMVLDKNLVDNFVKKYLKIKKYKNPKFNYLHTYISNLSKLDFFKNVVNNKKKVKKTVKKVKVTKHKKKIYVRLNLKRLLYMKEFGYENVVLPVKKAGDIQTDKKYNELKPYVNRLEYAIENIKIPEGYIDLIKNFDEYKTQLQEIVNLNREISEKMEDIELDSKITPQKNDNMGECLKYDAPLNKKCLNNNIYVNNYIYYAIKKDKLPPEEFILGYGNGKIFNDIGKYYFEFGEYEKSERYLLKAYTLLDGENKKIVAFNLGVLYATINTIEDNKKAVKYFKQSDLKEAYFNLGVNYYIGLGVKENDKKAFFYFKKAAEKGLSRAAYNLKQMKKLHLNFKN
jgi:tetratricopeptide (TPR) repeat protein